MIKKTLAVFLALAFCLLILGAVHFLMPARPQTPQQILAFQGDPPPQGGCSQCLGGNCYSAPCNMDCVPVGNGCETRVMGGAAAPYEPETKKANGDYAEFFMQRVVKNNEAMQAAGIEIGDTVVRVNGIYAGSDLEFANLVRTLPKGTTLTIWKMNGKRQDVTL